MFGSSKLKKELMKRIDKIADEVDKFYVQDVADIQAKRTSAVELADATYFQNIQDEELERRTAILAAQQEAEREEEEAIQNRMAEVLDKAFGKKK